MQHLTDPNTLGALALTSVLLGVLNIMISLR